MTRLADLLSGSSISRLLSPQLERKERARLDGRFSRVERRVFRNGFRRGVIGDAGGDAVMGFALDFFRLGLMGDRRNFPGGIAAGGNDHERDDALEPDARHLLGLGLDVRNASASSQNG